MYSENKDSERTARKDGPRGKICPSRCKNILQNYNTTVF